MSATSHTLSKNERLYGKRSISDLFDRGNTFFQSPYKVFWIKVIPDEPYASRFAVSVPKRRFKLAVKRNKMKRRTREVFRTNKQILNDVVADGQQVQLMVIYTSDRLLPVTELESAMKMILQRIAKKYAESD